MCLPCHQRHLLEQKLTEEGSILCRMSLVDKCHKPASTDNPKSSLYGRFCSSKCYQAYRQIDWCQHCKDARQDTNIDDEISLHYCTKVASRPINVTPRKVVESSVLPAGNFRTCASAGGAMQGWQRKDGSVYHVQNLAKRLGSSCLTRGSPSLSFHNAFAQVVACTLLSKYCGFT